MASSSLTLWIRSLLAVLLSMVIAAAALAGLASVYQPLRWSDVRSKSSLGRDLVRKRCGTCHSVDASASRCPPLHNIGKIGAERIAGMSAEAYILQSILEPNAFRVDPTVHMPAMADTLTDSEIREIVYFLANQGNEISRDAVQKLTIQRVESSKSSRPLDYELIQIGEQVFYGKGKCHSCHRYGSSLGPELHQTAGFSEAFLRESILAPHASVSGPYKLSLIQLRDGAIRTGVVVETNEREIELMVNTESGFGIEVISLEDVERDEQGKPAIKPSATSLMPSYEGVLDEREIQGLIEMLRALR